MKGNTVMQARRFVLSRLADPGGVSGTGIVADGCCWPDGAVTLRWRGPYRSTVHWDSLEGVIAVHGHGGTTEVVWLDTTAPAATPAPAARA